MQETFARALKPTTPEEVQVLVAEAGAAARRIEVMGSGSKRGIGALEPVDLALSTARLDRIIDYAPEELTLTAQPGVRVADLERICASRGQMLAFEPPRWTRLLASHGEPTLGGVLAAGLSGPRRPRAGAARDHLLGFHAVSGRGEMFKAGGRVVKNVTGYDLMKLMCGSWGSLAILTEVTIKVAPQPRTEVTLLLSGLADVRAGEAMTLALNGPFEVSGAAHMPAHAARALSLGASRPVTALRLEGFGASVAARRDALSLALRPFGVTETIEAEASRILWSEIREVSAFVGDPRPIWRLSLPPAVGWRAPHALPGDALFDWGGAVAWILTEAPAFRVRAVAAELGGHALCLRGHPAFGPRPEGHDALQAQIKAAFDPLGVLNPGRMEAAT